MRIEKCSLKDIKQLSLLNRQLIEDERSDNPMTIEELEERMRTFLLTEYDAYFFFEGQCVAGYALVKHSCQPLYLRHFLIERRFRRQGLGRKAFHLLLDTLETDHMDLEVLSHNEAGLRFYESLGFRELTRYLRFENGGNGR